MSDPPDTSLKHLIVDKSVKRGRPGNPPRSVKGRTLKANSLGPWDMLKAMRRLQLGEPMRLVARSYGISHNTLQRWQTRWGGDVAHIRWHLDVEHIKNVEVAHRRLARRLKRSLFRLKLSCGQDKLREIARKLFEDVMADLNDAGVHMAHIDGDGAGYWKAKRQESVNLVPSKSRWRKVDLADKAKGRLDAKAVRTPNYWDAR